MAWVRIDDTFSQHPKLLRAGPLGQQLLVAALCHSNRYLTDGWLAMDELRALGSYDGLFTEGLRSLPGVPEPIRVDDVIEKLIAASLLEYHDGRLLIHDFDVYQPSKAEVEAEREAARERMRLLRESRRVAGVSGSQDVKSFGRTSPEVPGRGTKERSKVCDECGVGAGLHVIGCSNARSEAVA